jgi:hypothetical protein
MRVAKTVEDMPPILKGLQFIAEFLNAVGPNTTREEWRAYLKRYIDAQRAKGSPLVLGPLVKFESTDKLRLKAAVTLRDAKQTRQFIKSDLRYLYFDRERIQTKEAPFGPLTLRLNTQFKAGTWHCVKLKAAKPEPGQAVLTRKRQDGATERWAASFQPFRVTRNLAEYCYAILGRALTSGKLGRLKICRHCGKYFVAVKDLGRDFCPNTTCKDAFFNRENRVQKWRKNKRALMIERAKALHKNGMPLDQIKTKTQMPLRVLKKLFGDLLE